MQFVLVVYEGPEGLAIMADRQKAGAYFAAWGGFAKTLAEAGALAGGTGMQSAHTATTLRFAEGGAISQDGSHGGAEHLSGFFVINAADQPSALAWAAKAPIAPGGAIEVRPAIGGPA
ncbi:Uncharacterized conserved protein [Pleomorphomonas diazotrophica]|nr:YciI family protein [Pleomorphomonas diazotrophica]SFM93813.1 Uncharacterized conserved protein [Pleomorphomonas diazotrophica]